MDKQQLGRSWFGIVLVTNLALLAFLYIYREPGEFYFGVPEGVIVLSALVTVIGATNSVMGWLYLGKPDLSELVTVQTNEEPGPRAVTEDD